MKETSLATIAKWAKGKLNVSPSSVVDSAVIDSRLASKKSLFFCIKGRRKDGHNYVKKVSDKGGYSLGEKQYCDIVVSSTVEALGEIAKEYRRTLDVRVVAVTGSNGKTTTTKMIECCLKGDYKIISSPRSFNNNIGLPLSILSMDDKTEIGVFEMGANHPGEIGLLSSIAEPEMGIINNVGEAHLGYFKSKKQILNAKFELANALPDGGTLIYNYDQEEIKNAADQYNSLKLIGFGFDKHASVSGKILKLNSTYSLFKVKGHEFKVNIPGTFNIYNSLAAITASWKLGVNFKDLSSKLRNFNGIPHRMQEIKAGGIDILDDCYNSNPTSIRNLFEELLKFYPQKDIIAVIGEMRELGKYSRKFHREAGKFLSQLRNIKYLLAGGKYAECLLEGASKGKVELENMHTFKSYKEAAGIIKKIVSKKTIVVLKASRMEKLENIINELKK